MSDKPIAKLGSTMDSLKKIGVMGYAMGSAVVGATVFWVNMTTLRTDFEQSKKDLKAYELTQELVIEALEEDLKDQHSIIHGLELDNVAIKTKLEQARSELDNIWKMKNEDILREINN